MDHELAIAIIKEYGEKQQSQRGTRLPCPCCGKDISSTYTWSRHKPARICESCTNSEIPPENWEIAHDPERWLPVRSHYFLVGRFNPIKKGYLEVQAPSWAEAKEIFRRAYPDIGWLGSDCICDHWIEKRYHNYGTIEYHGDYNPPLI